MIDDFDTCYRAASSRDARFDGCFYTAVRTTRIYCRPSCPALTPRRENTEFFQTAAAAQLAGFRACLRCRPDCAPGSPEWNVRGDLAGRAMRLIGDGLVDREGVAGLAARLHVSERHLHRQLVAELGAGPIALARSQRAHTARTLVEHSDLPMIDVAHSAGFGSLRQFNDTVRATFGRTPTALRARAGTPPARGALSGPGAADAPGGWGTGGRAGGGGGSGVGGEVGLRLSYREPFDSSRMLAFLGKRAIPGVEELVGDTYRRTLRLAHGDGVVAMRPGDGHVQCSVRLADLRDLTSAVRRCRQLLDLDADPVGIDAALAADAALAPLVGALPGLRVPGHVDPSELALRAVLGQQVTVDGATRLASQLVGLHGAPLAIEDPSLTHTFPTSDVVAAARLEELGMPAARRATLRRVAAALAAGELVLDPGADLDAAREALLATPGIGPWTAAYVVMRALSGPDEFLPGDAGVRRAARELGLPEAPGALRTRSLAWSPWRSYAMQHMWASIE